MKNVKQIFERINDKLIIRSHFAEYDNFLFSNQNLYRLHLHINPVRM